MNNNFFEYPFFSAPYDFPGQHWEPDSSGHQTQWKIEIRHRTELITPISKPRKRKGASEQVQLLFDEIIFDVSNYEGC